MNEVYDYVLEQVLKLKSTDNIDVHVEQGKFRTKFGDTETTVMWFFVVLIDIFTMRPHTYSFYSNQGDYELEDTLAQLKEKLNLLRNINIK